MAAEGVTQREIAEHFGFRDKSVVKESTEAGEKKGTQYNKNQRLQTGQDAARIQVRE